MNAQPCPREKAMICCGMSDLAAFGHRDHGFHTFPTPEMGRARRVMRRQRLRHSHHRLRAEVLAEDRSPIVDVRTADLEMTAAIAHARATLPAFWASYDAPKPRKPATP